MRGTLTNQDLSEVSEQECHDTSFCHKSPPVALIVNASSEEVCIQEKCSAHAALADLPIDEREQLLGHSGSVVSHMLSNCPIVGNYPKTSIR